MKPEKECPLTFEQSGEIKAEVEKAFIDLMNSIAV